MTMSTTRNNKNDDVNDDYGDNAMVKTNAKKTSKMTTMTATKTMTTNDQQSRLQADDASVVWVLLVLQFSFDADLAQYFH